MKLQRILVKILLIACVVRNPILKYAVQAIKLGMM